MSIYINTVLIKFINSLYSLYINTNIYIYKQQVLKIIDSLTKFNYFYNLVEKDSEK